MAYNVVPPGMLPKGPVKLSLVDLGMSLARVWAREGAFPDNVSKREFFAKCFRKIWNDHTGADMDIAIKRLEALMEESYIRGYKDGLLAKQTLKESVKDIYPDANTSEDTDGNIHIHF